MTRSSIGRVGGGPVIFVLRITTPVMMGQIGAARIKVIQGLGTQAPITRCAQTKNPAAKCHPCGFGGCYVV